ncbi:hypothetical protein BJ878DRAFT_276120 [Calycina marina]|uniref:ATPase synthesis protein 25 n=1 Tax=Calycina marina TaxID=1763456 RepID=A0A9P8CGS7_9HELO|nr:hypothetical protein BJ878DRAFT_276120 [Calycina marina]
MVVGRFLRVTGCASCRMTPIQRFAPVQGLFCRPISQMLQTVRQSRAQYSTGTTAEDDTQSTEDIYKEIEALEDTELETKSDGPAAEVSTLPWYLQVQTSQAAVQPLSEKQRIPELPESPPTILEPLLQQISVDLGIDDLSLLDLRKLDPPPALGANLVMIIGTARSEKHLHVSADRLCRWLRSTYKLRPDADGLLGRNELKLKLRRKSRRAKLLGSAVDENGDDGVRTGWVCVDVGVVDGPEGSTEVIAAPRTFVGFGRRTDGIRLVVQMMTEEKREEIDLEKLWGGILRRSLQAKTVVLEETAAIGDDPSISSPDQPRQAAELGNGTSPILSQARGFHTFA